jgi:hypothetical protein
MSIEEGSDSKTNSVVITSPNWDASDRFFSNISRKNYTDYINIKKYMNNLNTNDFKSFVFYRNSDHSDMNR